VGDEGDPEAEYLFALQLESPHANDGRSRNIVYGEDFHGELSSKIVLSKYTTSHRSSRFVEIEGIRQSSAVGCGSLKGEAVHHL